MGRDFQCLIVILLVATSISPSTASDENALDEFLDKHLLLLSNHTIERGLGEERESAPCRQYFQALNVAECCYLPNIDISRDGKTLFAGTKDGDVLAIDLRDGSATTLAKFVELGAIKLSSDGQSLGVVTRAGVSVIRLADKSVTPIFTWPNQLYAAGMTLSETKLAWNDASNQILIHGSMNGLWHYDFSTRASTEIKNAADAFFYDERVYVLRRATHEEKDVEIREIVAKVGGITLPLIITRLNKRLEEEKLSNLMPGGCDSYEGFEIMPIAGSPYLLCRFGVPMKNFHGKANQNIFIFDPSDRGFVPVACMDHVMSVCVEDSRETPRLLAKQGVFAEGKGLRVARLTAKCDRHSADGKFPWTWSVDADGFVTLRGSVNLKQETYRLDFKRQKALRDLIERISFCALPAKIGRCVPNGESRCLEVTFDDERTCRTILYPLDDLEAGEAATAGRFLELWTMIRGTFSSDWAFDDRAEIQAWKGMFEGEVKGE